MRSAETPGALCDNKIDALFWLLGHPNGLSKEATTTCDAVMVEVSGPAIDKLVADNSFYRKVVIPGGMYRGNPNDIPVFGVGATFVSSTATSVDTVYQVVKAVFENLDAFRKLHPAFANLKPEEMIRDSLTAPLHTGAIRYYAERGWMDPGTQVAVNPDKPKPPDSIPRIEFDTVVDRVAVVTRPVPLRKTPTPLGERLKILDPATKVNVVGRLKLGKDGHGPWTAIEELSTSTTGYVFGEWKTFAALESSSARGPTNIKTFGPSGKHGEKTGKTWGKKYAIVIGISDYDDLKPSKEEQRKGRLVDLRFAEADAESFVSFLRDDRYFGGTPWEIFSLIGPGATRREIMSTISHVLSKGKQRDLVYLFFAGHARVAPAVATEVYLMSYDTEFDDGFDGVPYAWLIENISRSKAGYVFAFMDACRSGTIEVARGAGRPNQTVLAELGAVVPTKVMFTAGTGAQQAHEDEDLGHGVFTYFLLKGLRGSAVDEDHDGLVDLNELSDYVGTMVHQYTKKHPEMTTQTPRLWDKSGLYPEHLPLAIRQ